MLEGDSRNGGCAGSSGSCGGNCDMESNGGVGGGAALTGGGGTMGRRDMSCGPIIGGGMSVAGGIVWAMRLRACAVRLGMCLSEVPVMRAQTAHGGHVWHATYAIGGALSCAASSCGSGALPSRRARSPDARRGASPLCAQALSTPTTQGRRTKETKGEAVRTRRRPRPSYRSRATVRRKRNCWAPASGLATRRE